MKTRDLSQVMLPLRRRGKHLFARNPFARNPFDCVACTLQTQGDKAQEKANIFDESILDQPYKIFDDGKCNLADELRITECSRCRVGGLGEKHMRHCTSVTEVS